MSCPEKTVQIIGNKYKVNVDYCLSSDSSFIFEDLKAFVAVGKINSDLLEQSGCNCLLLERKCFQRKASLIIKGFWLQKLEIYHTALAHFHNNDKVYLIRS